MSSPLVAVLCTALLVLCVGGGVRSETKDLSHTVDSVKLLIVSKQDDDGKWVNEVKLEHGNEKAPWKVEVEQKTLDKGGRETVELSAILTGPKPAPKPTAAPREISESLLHPHPDLQSGRLHLGETVFEELRTSWRGSQYTVYTTQVDWVTANKTCTDAGSYLAIINSEEEATFFSHMLNKLPGSNLGAFVGITDEGEEGMWMTVKGVPISDAGFAKWYRSDQPDNANGDENCGIFFPWAKGFNDVPCSDYLAQLICEKDDEAMRIEAPFDTSRRYLQFHEINWDSHYDEFDLPISEEQEQQKNDIPGSDYTQFEGFTSLYKVHSTQMDWERANKTCIEEGAHLAVINSEAEAMMLAGLLNQFYADSHRGAFVGITDKAEEGIWLTVFGETTSEAGFARWFRSDQPDNAGNEDCGAIYPVNGGFNDVPCTRYLMHSICEKDEVTDTLKSLENISQDLSTTIVPEEIESETETSIIDKSTEIVSSVQMTTVRNDYQSTFGYVRYSDRHYYKLHVDTDKNWHQAQLTCEMEGGVLANIEANEKFQFIVDLLFKSPLVGTSKVFTGFGSNMHVESYRFDVLYDDNDVASDTDMCEAVDAVHMSMAIVHCDDRLPFICESNRVPDFAYEQNPPNQEASEEFDNSVDLPNYLPNFDEQSKGGKVILDYIGQKREKRLMTTSLPEAEISSEEISPWAGMELGGDYYDELL